MNIDLLIPGLNPFVSDRPMIAKPPRQRTRKNAQRSDRHSWQPCASRARQHMIKHGLTYERLAQELRTRGHEAVTAHAVVRVIQGITAVPYLRSALADYFGVPVERLWPERRVA